MKKAVLLLMLVAVVVMVWLLMRPAPELSWQPKTSITFINFTNPVAGAPATNAWFGIKDNPQESGNWEVVEISYQEAGSWKPWEPLPVKLPSFRFPMPGSFNLTALVPVPTTNAPLRVVFELEQMPIGCATPLAGKVTQFFADLRLRGRRLLHPHNPREWLPHGPRFYITNEFNFAAGTNGGGGKETGR